MENYYEILEVDKNASLDTIKKIYKYKIKQNHPDLFTGKERQNAEKLTKKLNEAYEVLSDSNLRKIYDEQLSSNDLEKENKMLKDEIELLNNYINDQKFKEIYDEIPENENKTEELKYDNQLPFYKNLFSLLSFTFKNVFLKPIIFVLILLLILLILKHI